MNPATYPIIQIQTDDVIRDEQLGTKDKFWFEHDGQFWLFKETREIKAPTGVEWTGEDWAEKIASEIARLIAIPAAHVELATYGNKRGCASLDFTGPGSRRALMHGNEVLAGYLPGYDRDKRFRQMGHTLDNIILAVRRMFTDEQQNRAV